MEGLTTLQRIYFWTGALLPIPSIAVFIFFPAGTIEYFGGTSSPTADFWCSIAAAGDAMFSSLCWSVLYNPNDLVLRSSVLRANAVYSIFHWGRFVVAHYTLEPLPGGPFGYIVSILICWVAYIVWGCKGHNPSSEKGENQSLYQEVV